MTIPGLVLHPSAASQLGVFLAAPSHAVLLGGPTGSGKTHVAEALALQLLGTATASIENRNDYRVIMPMKNTISIEQIRELGIFFRLKMPGHARIQRIAVLQDADCMGHEAQNALLKLLEEPPQASLLILTSSQPQTLLATIRSRLQTIQLHTPSRASLLEHFTLAGYRMAAASSALRRAGTNLAEAQRLLDAETGADDSAMTLAKQALAGTSYERMLLVDGLAKQKEVASDFVATLLTVATASLESAASRAGATSSLVRWKAVLQAAYTAQTALERNGNTKLVLTELMFSL